MRRISIAGMSAIGACSLLVVGGAITTHASPSAARLAPAAIAAAATTTITLPLFGAPLTVDITSAPGGDLASVSLNPAGGFTATQVKPNQVRFDFVGVGVNAGNTAKLAVSSKGGGQNVSTKAGQLKDVAGPGKWTGDVFGTGKISTVDFIIAAQPDGSPDITGVVVASGSDTATIGAVDRSSEENEQTASVKILFTSGIQERTLKISVKVELPAVQSQDGQSQDGQSQDPQSHESESHAKVSVSLSRIRGQQLPTGQIVGPQTWNGVLCDGSVAKIDYIVQADGSISGVKTTPATAQVQTTGDNGIKVTFSDKEQVKIRVKTENGQSQVSVKDKFHCDNPTPSVNTPTAVDGSGDHSGDHGGKDHGSKDAGSADTVSTSSTTPKGDGGGSGND